MDDIALPPRLQPSSSSLNQTQHLCEEWENAWANLSACNASQDSDVTVDEPLQHHTSFCRRIYALVDLPNTRNHTAVLQTAQERLAALVKQIPPPHIPLASDEFRLLRFEPTDYQGAISVSLVNKSLDEVGDDYSAVSYCWGPPTQPQKLVIVNGRPVVIFEALLTLLSHFQTFASGYYWIDAICIRQDDVLEKNTQIPLMTRIYSGARTVDIWLGPDQDDSAHVLELAHRRSADALVSVKFLRGLDRLLNRQWFSRVWVIQEVVLSKSYAPVVRSGFAACSWDELMVAPHELCEDDSDLSILIAARERELVLLAEAPVLEPLIDETEDEGEAELDARLAVLMRNYAILQAHKSRRAKEVEWHRTLAHLRTTLADRSVRGVKELREQYCHDGAFGLNRLQELMWRTRRYKATNPRDKIYGVLGILDNSPLNVDYNKPVFQVYCEATRVTALESAPATFVHLMYLCPVVGIPTKLNPQPASWALDFSHTSVWAEHLIDSTPLWSDTDSDTSADADSSNSFKSNEPAIQCKLEESELKTSASTVDVIVQMLECPDIVIGDALSNSDTRALQLLRYLADLQGFYETHTRSARARNPQVCEGLLGIITQLPINQFATYTREECVEKYAALVTASDKFLASEAAVSAAAASGATAFELAASADSSERAVSKAAASEDASETSDSEEEEEAEEATPGEAEAIAAYEYSEPLSSLLYEMLITRSVFRTSFFITRRGLCGLCMPSARSGDTVSVLFHGNPDYPNLPFVIRPRDDGRYSMVAIAWVQREWEDLARACGTLDPRMITLR
jgi:hypothetical protein